MSQTDLKDSTDATMDDECYQPAPELQFRGEDAAECEDFISTVHKYLLSQEKQPEDRWMAHFVASFFTQDALRWWITLDESVQGSWKLLRKAMLSKFRPPLPLFLGEGGEEAENFVHMITERALDEGRYEDPRWVAAFASTYLGGDALRWWAALPPNIRKDWDVLQQAILMRYPTIPKHLIPTPAAAAPPPRSAQKPLIRGRVVVMLDGDSRNHYISRQFSPGSLTVLTMLPHESMEFGFDPTCTENGPLLIFPGQLAGFDALAIHWVLPSAPGDQTTNFAILCVCKSMTGEGALTTCRGPLVQGAWTFLLNPSAGIPKFFGLVAKQGSKPLYPQAHGAGFPITFLQNPAPDKAARLFLETF